MKIAMVVPNSAARDARVMKEALTLAQAGHEIHVIGTQEQNFPSYRFIHDENIEIYRVPFVKRENANKSALYLVAYLIIIVLLAGIGSLLIYIITKYLDFSFFTALFQPSAPPGAGFGNEVWSLVKFLAVLVILAFSLFFVRRPLTRWLFRHVYLPLRVTKTNMHGYLNALARRMAITRGLYDKIVEIEPDLIYCHEVMALAACAKASQRLGVKLVYDAHEFYDDLTGHAVHFVNRINRYYHRKYLRYVDLFVTVSETILKAYHQAYKRYHPPAIVLPNSVIPEKLSTYDGRLHKEAKLPEEQKIVLYQGGITTSRNVHKVLLSAEHLPEGWSVVLMGTSNDMEKFTSMAAKINDSQFKIAFINSLSAQEEEYLKDRTKYYFDLLYIKNRQTDHMIKLSREEDDSLRDRENFGYLNLTAYVETSFRSSLKNLPVRIFRAKTASAYKALQEDISKWKRSILESTDHIIDLEKEVHHKAWMLAHELAIQDLIREFGKEVSFTPRASIIPQVPREELFLWSQGATLGVIPYPITSLNHWGCAPNKLWEYPAAGVPILSTPSREIYQIIKQYGIGWVFAADINEKSIPLLLKNLSEEDIQMARRNCKAFISESNWLVHQKPWKGKIEGLRDKA